MPAVPGICRPDLGEARPHGGAHMLLSFEGPLRGTQNYERARRWWLKGLGYRRRAPLMHESPSRVLGSRRSRRGRRGRRSRRTLKTAQLAKEIETFNAASQRDVARSPSRYEGHTVDALAPGVDEGRGRLR